MSHRLLTIEEATEIASRYGLDFETDRLMPDFEQANRFASYGAALLFEGYCRDQAHQNACESREAARNEEMAFGSPDDPNF